MKEGRISATQPVPVLQMTSLDAPDIQRDLPIVTGVDPVIVRLQDAMRSIALELVSGGRQRFTAALEAANGAARAEALCCEALVDTFRELWTTDNCDDVEMSIALALALSVLRQQTASRALEAAADSERPILVVPVPGEKHIFGAAIAAHALENAGRNVIYQIPQSRDELCRLVMARRFEWVVLVTSGIYTRSSMTDFVQYCVEGLQTYSTDRLKIGLYGRHAELPGVADGGYLDFASARLSDLLDIVPRYERAVH